MFRLLILLLSSAAAAAVIVGVGDRIITAVSRGHADNSLWDNLHRCRIPLGITLFTAALLGGAPATREPLGGTYDALRHIVVLVLIGALAWLTARLITLTVSASYDRYASSAADRGRVRRVGTRLAMVRRVTVAVVAVVAIAIMLLTFPGVRAVGASLLASAGLIGIVAGVAAQSSLGNLFAGLQVAFSDMVRIGDVVVVDEQYGTVEEITLNHIVVATWDERRIVMPVSYFAGKSYENWTRQNPQMLGTVFFQLDHRTPVALLRDELQRLLEASDLWDGRSWSLVVTDTTASGIQVRALVSTRDADDLFTLRCLVRERLTDFLVREHPYALPRIATAPAAERPGADAEDGATDHTAAETRERPR